jgi:hypothetical protein
MSTNLPGGASAPSFADCCAAIDKGRANSINMQAEHRFQNALVLRMTLFLLIHIGAAKIDSNHEETNNKKDGFEPISSGLPRALRFFVV